MRLVCLVVMTVCVGCWPKGDGPWDDLANDPCSPGNIRPTGAACSLPVAAVYINSDAGDWSTIEQIPLAPACKVPPCDGLAPAALQLATTSAGLLAMHVTVQGGAPRKTDTSVRYVVELTGTDEFPTPESDRLQASASELDFLKNDYLVNPPNGGSFPYQFTWTSDGFELAIATSFLPFPAGARVGVYATQSATDEVISDSAPLARACWLSELATEGTSGKDQFVADPCRKRKP